MKVLLLLLPLAACATTPETGRGLCNAVPVQSFVGAIGTAQLGRQAMTRAGAKMLRFIPPNSAVTMDYRSDRLNVRLDARNFVTGLDCG